MKVLVSGLYGHMGREVAALLLKGVEDGVLTSGVSLDIDDTFAVPCAEKFADASADVDVIVDFSHHSCTKDLLEFAVFHHIPVVLATTGQTEEEKQMITDASKQIPLFFAANYSIGIALLIDLAKKAAAVMSGAEIEIIERHHNRKLDAPSGTALAIAHGIQEVRPQARMGNIVGIHEVVIGTDNQSITLKHEAYSRALFAEGALKAAAFLQGKPDGLYDMKSLLEE